MSTATATAPAVQTQKERFALLLSMKKTARVAADKVRAFGVEVLEWTGELVQNISPSAYRAITRAGSWILQRIKSVLSFIKGKAVAGGTLAKDGLNNMRDHKVALAVAAGGLLFGTETGRRYAKRGLEIASKPFIYVGRKSGQSWDWAATKLLVEEPTTKLHTIRNWISYRMSDARTFVHNQSVKFIGKSVSAYRKVASMKYTAPAVQLAVISITTFSFLPTAYATAIVAVAVGTEILARTKNKRLVVVKAKEPKPQAPKNKPEAEVKPNVEEVVKEAMDEVTPTHQNRRARRNANRKQTDPSTVRV